ncbi:MAG: hypothetical protein WBD41_18410 [Rhodococcus sp. (in: high G+C Gram-positive bacteria)]
MTITFFCDLNDEWAQTARSRAAIKSLQQWKLVEPALAEFRHLDSIVDRAHGADRSQRDEVLAALLRCGKSDGLALRVVLHIEMPGLVCITNRFLPGPHASDEVASVVVAAAWQRIVNYPLDRRPRNIGGNIGLDTRQTASNMLFRNAGREIPDADLATYRTPAPSTSDPAVALAKSLTFAAQRRVVSFEDARLVALTRIYDVPIDELASQRGILPQSLRKRRLRVEASLVADVA